MYSTKKSDQLNEYPSKHGQTTVEYSSRKVATSIKRKRKRMSRKGGEQEYPDLVAENFPKTEGETITLQDGRCLGFCEYRFQHLTSGRSPLSERVILLIPGIPGTRFFCHPHVLHSSGSESNHNLERRSDENVVTIRLFVLERPGIGLSTFAKRSFLDFAEDVREFLAAKQIRECDVLAYSAGGPYGLALAHSLGRGGNEHDVPLVRKTAIVSSVSPYATPSATATMPLKLKLAWWMTKYAPRVLGWLARYEANTLLKDPVTAFRSGINEGPPADRELIAEFPGVERMFLESALEMYTREQITTEIYEYSMWGKDWGFRLEDIGKGVKCKVWHGEEDNATTPVMGHYIIDHIQGCEARFVEGKGHLLYFEAWEEIIDWLVTE